MKIQNLRFARATLLSAASTIFFVASAAAATLPPSYPANSAALFASIRDDQTPTNGVESNPVLAAHLQRQVVNYPTLVAAGTVVIDTAQTYLYYVLGAGKAIRYGIGVGRDGFSWSGTQTVNRMAEWPDWTPPQEMIERQPYLPRWMAGGDGNPLGARAMYLGSTVYRIHGTNAPQSIGTRVSSGCIRLTNADVTDLYGRVKVGTKIIMLANPGQTTRAAPINAGSVSALASVRTTAY